MIDLFNPPKITPRPTRLVQLCEPWGREYRPRARTKKPRKLDMSPKAVATRARQAEWVRLKRRQDAEFRERANQRERERYAAMPEAQKAAVLERNKLAKREMRRAEP